MTPTTTYRLAAGLALATVIFLVLAIGALGINGAGGSADRMYLVVPAVLVVGTVVARLRPHAMALALAATALCQLVLAVVALVAGMNREPGASVLEILGINVMYAVLFGLAGWLFERSAHSGSRAPADAHR